MSHNFNIENNNLYEVLGITQEATPIEIKKAYKKAIHQIYPNKGFTEKQEE
jgi:DnaJ-class molecular chaperone